MTNEKTVFEYFEEQGGVAPTEQSLSDLPIDSPCGADCKQLIYAAKVYWDLTKAIVGDRVNRGLILRSVNHAVEVLWLSCLG